MAKASITHAWPDGTTVQCEVDSGEDTTHPDLLDELVARVLRLYQETCVGDGEE